MLTESAIAVQSLRIAIIGIVFLGATAPGATAVFFFSDPMMGILAVVNLLALMMLFPIALRILNDFRAQLAAGITRPVLDPEKFPDLDIDRRPGPTRSDRDLRKVQKLRGAPAGAPSHLRSVPFGFLPVMAVSGRCDQITVKRPQSRAIFITLRPFRTRSACPITQQG